MKKLLIASASLLALSAGAAFAQSAGQSNTSGLFQSGSGNSVTIDQAINAGACNTSNVYQGVNGDGSAASNSSVSVTQIGGVGSQTTSTATQNGSSQTAAVSQDATKGGQLTSAISQSGGGNTATVTQVSSNITDVQNSSITQTGARGVASVSQQGPADGAIVTQSGDYYGRVTVIQSGTGDTPAARGRFPPLRLAWLIPV